MQMTPVTPPHERKAAKTGGLIGRAGFKCIGRKPLRAIPSGRSGRGAVLFACKASASSVGNAGEVFAFQGFVQMVRRRVGFVPGAAPLLLAVEPAIRVHDQQCARGIPSQFLDDFAWENGRDEAFPERNPALPE